VRTNILVFRVGAGPAATLDDPPNGPAAGFLARLKEQGILASQFGPDRVRLVTHRDVGAADVDRAVEVLRGMA
jgi:threonine aldolase